MLLFAFTMSLFPGAKVSGGLLIDVSARTDRNDFDEVRNVPIDNPNACYAQTPIAFEFVFELFPAGSVFENMPALIGLSASVQDAGAE